MIDLANVDTIYRNAPRRMTFSMAYEMSLSTTFNNPRAVEK